MKQTIYLSCIAAAIILASCKSLTNNNAKTVNLEERWDTLRALENPDKGWYHFMLDNGIDKYLIQDESELHQFPGMDHLYLRLAWAYLEPEEGMYNWEVIDTIIDKYVPQGYGISFRISCKETGWVPGSIPVEIDGVGFATPPWVKEAGAKGVIPERKTPVWTPDWDDPVFLSKLDNFHSAFAERYDGKPWVRYVDIGSIGDWGEGHTSSSTNIAPTVGEVKAHMDLYLKNYKHSQLACTDDLLYFKKDIAEVDELYEYAMSNNISLRDDSPMVGWYVETCLDTWTVSHPRFFEGAYKKMPTVFEPAHYSSVKRNGHWLGRNGHDTIPGTGVTGADIFRNSMKLIHPTYIGFHGYLGEWYNENPELTDELLNLCGYWYFPVSFQFESFGEKKLAFRMEWLNKGVAPAYHDYSLRGKLQSPDDDEEVLHFEIPDAGNRDWMPGELAAKAYEAVVPGELTGGYALSIQLFDEPSGRPVEIGLKREARDEEGYYWIRNLFF